jgi:uncharacterized protein involved in exopolysaccharide biosynthesis
MLIGGGVAAVLAFSRPTLYSATASFIPQGADPGRSGLAGLAGQLGVALPATNQGLSPEFYVKLIRSRELLKGVVRDTLVVQELSGRRIPFLSLFDIEGSTANRREEEGVRLLMTMIKASATKATGVVEFSVATKWPSVSVAIATAVVTGINDFNQRLRQEQAGAERKFVEARLTITGSDLRATEDRLEDFLRTNRQFASSPDLTFQRDRLQRDVTLKQQVYTSLTQAYEEVRIREVRDTPVITLVEEPSMPTLPEPGGRLLSVLLGLLFGGFLGVVSAAFSESVIRGRRAGDPYAYEFSGTLGEIKGEVVGRVRRLTEKIRR